MGAALWLWERNPPEGHYAERMQDWAMQLCRISFSCMIPLQEGTACLGPSCRQCLCEAGWSDSDWQLPQTSDVQASPT